MSVSSAGFRVRAAGAAATMALAMLVTAVPARADGPWFVNATKQAGLRHTHMAVSPPVILPPETGGAAVGDVTGNGHPDLYFTILDGPDILYANQGDGTFLDVSEQVMGSDRPGHGSNGALLADLNNNGHLDLFVNGGLRTSHYLLINTGQGTLVDRTAEYNIGPSGDAGHLGQGATAGDYTGNGYLDLYVPDWSSRRPRDPPRNRLLRNDGGHFTDVTELAGLDGMENQHGFAGRFADLNRNGRLDLVVANDFGTSALYWNQGDGTFIEAADDAGYGTGTNDMGLAVADYNNNGWLDIFTTSIGNQGQDPLPAAGNRLYRNEMGHDLPGLYLTDRTDDAGVRWGNWGWGASFIDYNNNGLRDLVMVNGYPVPSYRDTPMRFWENQGDGTFIEKSAELGLTDDGDGRGVIVADFNNDGWLDILVIRHNDTPVLYQNRGGDNHWLRIDTVGTLSNRQGIGAWITVVPDLDDADLFYVHEVNLGSNYAGHNETTAHFGLGQLDGAVDYVHIRWPSGVEQELFNVSPNQVLTVTEIPEPGSAAMVAALAGLLLMRRLRRKP